MADIPADTSKKEWLADENTTRWLERAVPLFSFGGALLAILFLVTNSTIDFRVSILGCVIASWVLAYLAWIRPKKDIVALTTPIYSFIFIAVPTDIFSSVVLELLYAVSLTLLLVRLKSRFGNPGTALSDRKDLAEPLRTYIDQTRAAFSGIRPETSHQAALVFVRFAEGEYGEAARVAGTAAGQIEEGSNPSSLTRAFEIVKEHATLLDMSLPCPRTFLTFSPEDSRLLAKPEPVSGEEQEFYLALDNALLVVFSAAWNRSERDHLHLLACQAFALKLLTE